MSDTPVRLTSESLADRYDRTSARWWRDRLPELAARGIVNRIGRQYYGRVSAVDRWLAGENGRRSARRSFTADAGGGNL